jgi:NAD(P)-dependent dehydrogenase (short-subunit alcohol dehydrogenase family)
MGMRRFEGKVAIVTGGGTGIGRETAICLAREGAKVVIANRSQKNADETLERIIEAGGNGVYIRTNVGNSADIQFLIQETIRQFGGLDMIVHSAAIESLNSVVELPEEEWHAVLNVNLTSAYLLGKYGIPYMLARGGGAIVNVASVHSHATIERHAAYAASKGGLLALTKSMAIDYAASGIRVNAVLPGATATSMLDRWATMQGNGSANPREDWKHAQPLGRIGEPHEVANLICFLLSDEASFMIGSGIVIDGGMLARL